MSESDPESTVRMRLWRRPPADRGRKVATFLLLLAAIPAGIALGLMTSHDSAVPGETPATTPTVSWTTTVTAPGKTHQPPDDGAPTPQHASPATHPAAPTQTQPTHVTPPSTTAPTTPDPPGSPEPSPSPKKVCVPLTTICVVKR